MDCRPGLHERRLTGLMRAAIERCRLDLAGLTVLTEAASGAYVVTPVLAAMAGAERVMAVTRATRYGSVEEIRAATMALARQSGVAERIEVVDSAPCDLVSHADVITNSGHVRPIDRPMIERMKPGAVIALMYENWEYRHDDLDLDACRRAGVLVGGTTEQHPDIDVFSYLGPMAVRLLHDAGVSAYRASILLLCDNPFRAYLERGLRAAGATVETVSDLAAARGGSFDAIVVSLTPRATAAVNGDDAALIAARWPGAVVAQFWGDLDRRALAAAQVPVWTPEGPKPGHMGILLSDLGPEPIVRLQSGGLKAAEALWRHRAGQSADMEYVEILDELTSCHEFCS